MPTGYTAIITDKPDTSFEQFALLCSRAFGACIMMRDDNTYAKPTRKKISDSSTHYEESLEEATKQLKWLLRYDHDHMEFIKRTEKEHQRHIELTKERLFEKREKRILYEAMLDKVNEWKPPTDDHKKFKEFMINQITESLNYDCDEYDAADTIKKLTCEKLNYKERHDDALKLVRRDIEYYRKNVEKLNERMKSRIRWMEELCDSLGIEFE